MSTVLGTTPTYQDVGLYAGDYASLTFTHDKDAGAGITGAWLQVRNKSGALVLELTLAGAPGQWSFAVSNQGTITFLTSDTYSLAGGVYTYTISVQDATSTETYQEGDFVLYKRLTDLQDSEFDATEGAGVWVQNGNYVESSKTTTDYRAWAAVTATVTWPDGATGHINAVALSTTLAGYKDYDYFTVSYENGATGKIFYMLPDDDTVYEVVPDYYVDSVGGSGANGGAAPNDAFAAISDLPAFSGGEVVALKSGSTWLERLELDKASVSVYRFGAGAMPILDARDSISAGSWSVAGGTATYSASITFDGQITGFSTFVSVWEDGTRLQLGSGAATLSSGQYYVASHTSGSTTIYVRASDDGDLTAGAHTIKFSKRYYGVGSRVTASGGTFAGSIVDGIRCIGNTDNNGSGDFGRSTVLRHCLFEEGTKHNLYYADGSALYGVVCEDFYYNAAATLFVFNEDTPADLGITHRDCAAVQGSTYPDPTQSTAYHGHHNVSGTFGAVTYTRCSAIDITGSGWTPGFTASLTWDGCHVENCSLGWRIADAVAHTIRRCTFTADSIQTRLMEFQSAGTTTVSECTVCVTGTATVNGGALIYMNLANVTMTWQGNIFYLRPGSGSLNTLTVANTTGANWTFSGNYMDQIGGRYYDFGGNAVPAGFDSDSNCFEDIVNPRWRYSSTDYVFADWVTNTGHDDASTTGGCGAATPCT